jgi:glycosyltransferase involved in cell wall biosynthesis
MFAVLRKIDLQASRSPDIYIANSREVQARIQKYYKRDSIVIWPSVDTEKFKINPPRRTKLKISERSFYVITSALTPFKRVDIAVRALSELGIPLKIIGSGAQEEELKKLAGPSIEFLGRLSDEEIVDVYREAR